MGKLLRFNLRKLVMQKSAYICLAIILGLCLIYAVAYKLMMDSNPSSPEISLTQQIIAARTGGLAYWLFSLMSSNFTMVFGIAVAIIVCEDFDQRTIKNIIARGYSATQLYFSKLIIVFIAVTVAFAVTEVAAFAISSAFFGVPRGDIAKAFGLIMLQYLGVLANTSFVFAISYIIKRMGFSIATVIISPLIIQLLLLLADTLINSKDIALSDYWIDTYLQKVCFISASEKDIAICLFGSIAYIAGFVLLGALFRKKKEI